MPLERRAEGPRSKARGATDIMPNRFPGVPGREVLPRPGERNGEQAEAEAVEPWRAKAGGSPGACRETLDRKRCTKT